MENVVQFPTDVVRAEAEIDRAHQRWLDDQKAKHDDRIIFMAVTMQEPCRTVRCSEYDLEVYDTLTGIHKIYFGAYHDYGDIFDEDLL